MPENQITSIENEFVIHGLRRSGNHAITNWILGQIKGDMAYYNDVWPNEPYNNYPSYSNTTKSRIDYSIISYEDYNLKVLSKIKQKKDTSISNTTNILILRDPFNLLASRFRSNKKTPAHYSGLNLRQLYMMYSLEYEGKTNLLGVDKVVISYNEWKNSKSYREDLAKKLGLMFNDKAINKVTGQGGGSSFDGMALKGQELKTENRYYNFKDDYVFLNWFINIKILEFSKKYFFIPKDLKLDIKQPKRFLIQYYDIIIIYINSDLFYYLRQLFLIVKRFKLK